MSLLIQGFYAVPVVGWMAKDAVKGHSDAKYYFGFNAAVILVGLTYFIGYPFVICVALAGAAAALVGLIVLTSFDAMGRPPEKISEDARRARNKAARAARKVRQRA
ncbi:MULTISPECIES: hypothetical protein [Rhodopseudomonas]|uniref:Uncharacterized protein n=1 Tax=Rhodopseudomonas palustris TaxID=1076 RepID=A0A0D7ETH0_RHOPL|nr:MULTISPECIES: hypothetical protein [Rhodopseudomonas]KIZ44139.1 hypothetical protein OO17_10255 [Rhodopseudomonas palustris]MDF3814014.1 hypothetical protein [Rhodopseudomonas sp. BAL398]WOK19669.1 hypothetical protein RBJ75_09195 [Rhodopseudomonas sp. BAL398]